MSTWTTSSIIVTCPSCGGPCAIQARWEGGRAQLLRLAPHAVPDADYAPQAVLCSAGETELQMQVARAEAPDLRGCLTWLDEALRLMGARGEVYDLPPAGLREIGGKAQGDAVHLMVSSRLGAWSSKPGPEMELAAKVDDLRAELDFERSESARLRRALSAAERCPGLVQPQPQALAERLQLLDAMLQDLGSHHAEVHGIDPAGLAQLGVQGTKEITFVHRDADGAYACETIDAWVTERLHVWGERRRRRATPEEQAALESRPARPETCTITSSAQVSP